MRTPIILKPRSNLIRNVPASRSACAKINPSLLQALRTASCSAVAGSRWSQIERPPAALPSDLEGRDLVRFLIAYEDFATGHSAMRICDNLVRHLGPEFQSQTASWKFEFLRVAKLATMATQDAIEADVVIISAHGGAGLPAEVKGWLEGWRNQTPRVAKALVALLDHGEERAEPQFQVRTYLDALAHESGFSFFSHVCPTAGIDVDYAPNPATRVQPRSWVSDRSSSRPTLTRQWGINE